MAEYPTIPADAVNAERCEECRLSVEFIAKYGHKAGCAWDLAQWQAKDDAARAEATPELVASLREQVRTLTTDNAAQHKALLGVEHVFDRDDSRYYCPECGKERPAHDEACSIGHALHGAHSPGAALLAEMDALHARVAELEAERSDAVRHAMRMESERDAAQQRAKALEEAVGSIIFAVRRRLALKDWDGSLFAARSEWQAIDDAFPKETK